MLDTEFTLTEAAATNEEIIEVGLIMITQFNAGEKCLANFAGIHHTKALMDNRGISNIDVEAFIARHPYTIETIMELALSKK